MRRRNDARLGLMVLVEVSGDLQQKLRKLREGVLRETTGSGSQIELETLSKAEKPRVRAWTTGLFRGLLVRSHALS